MSEIKPQIQTIAKIKIIGIGGSGSSTINRMMDTRLKSVDYIAMNTDLQALNHCRAPVKIHLGKNITRGLGAGMNPDLGRKAAEESANEIRDALKNSDMVFITCGLGGGTGSGASPVVAEIAKSLGALTIVVVTKPFAFEGLKRKEIAEEAYTKLAEKVDTIITIHNDRILQLIDKKTSLIEAFRTIDDVLKQGIESVSDIINVPGLINIDFADLKAIIKNTGSALLGVGRAKGDNRAVNAAKMAIESPLLELSIAGAQGILFTITGGTSLSMHEVQEAAKLITKYADEEAKIIFGAVIDENLKDEIKIIVIATGFNKETMPEIPQANPEEYLNTSTVTNNLYGAKIKDSGIIKESDVDAINKKNTNATPIENKDFLTLSKIQDKPSTHTHKTNSDFDIPAFLRKKIK